MKKTILNLLILLFSIVLLPQYCVNADAVSNGDLRNKIYVGFGKSDITPVKNGKLMDNIPIAGSGNSQFRIAEPVIYNGEEMPVYPGQELTASAVALKDFNDNIIVFVTCDSLLFNQPMHDGSLSYWVRDIIYEDTGIAKENIIISTTHTHSAVDTSFGNADYPEITQAVVMYKKDILSPGIVNAVKEAINNLSLATVSIGSVDILNDNGKNALNFDRHYKTDLYYLNSSPLRNIYFGENHGLYGYNSLTGTWNASATHLIDHASDGDPQLQMIKFDVEGNNKDILMVNWQVHPLITGGADFKTISADLIAPFRNKVEDNCNCNVAYYNGAAGDLQVNTYSDLAQKLGEGIDGISHNFKRTDSKVKYEESVIYGEKLADYVIESYDNLKKVNFGTINVKKESITLEAKNKNDSEYTDPNSHLLVNAKFCKLIWDADFSDIEKMINGTYEYPSNFVFPNGYASDGEKLRDMIMNHPTLNATSYFNISNDGNTFTFKNRSRSYIRQLIAFIGLNFSDGEIIESVYHANSVISNSLREENNINIKIGTVMIGDISFVIVPYEMFSANGKYIKQNSAGDMTFVMGYSDGHFGYIPSNAGYDYGCYESDTSSFKKGSGELVASKLVNNINNFDNLKKSLTIGDNLIKNDSLLFIKNTDPDILISTFINGIASNSSLSVLDSNNNEIINRDTIITGDNLIVKESNDTVSYTILNSGDVDSNGIVNDKDSKKIAKYIIDKETDIRQGYLLAGDMDNNYVIKMNDVVMLIKKYKNN